MSAAQPQFDFATNRQPLQKFQSFEHIIEDRGSRYAVSIGLVHNRNDIQEFLHTLKKQKKYRKATHNSWAVRVASNGAVFETKQDDGEVGAGLVILRTLQKRKTVNIIVCVTRWFGGVKLQGDRFKHVQSATNLAIDYTIDGLVSD